jgi:hypothetical protein
VKGGRRGPHSHVGGAGRCQEGGIGLEGGGEPQAKPAGAQGKGKLGDHSVQLHDSGRRALHQVEGGEKHPPLGGSELGGEPRPRGDAGKMGSANLKGGAKQEELVLPAQGKGGEGSDQAGDGLGPGASVGLNKRVRAEGRAGSHKPLWAMGNTQGRGNGQAGGCGLSVRGALGEGGGEANRGGRSDQGPEGFDGRFRGALQVRIVRIRHHADVRIRLPHHFEGALQG